MGEKEKQDFITVRFIEIASWLPYFGEAHNEDLVKGIYNYVAYEAEPLCNQLYIKQSVESQGRSLKKTDRR